MNRILSATALVAVLLTASAASAQYRDGAVLLTVNAGSVIGTSDLTDNSITGNAAGFTLEKVLADGRFNAGFSIIWVSADEFADLREGQQDKVTYSSVPFVITGRYNLLNSRFTANIGLGIGLHTSSRALFEGTIEERSSSASSMALSLPVQVAYFVDPDLYFQFIYTPTWMSTSAFKDDMAHTFAGGIGFQWGNDED